MKIFEVPEMKVIRFNSSDVIASSICDCVDCPDGCPEGKNNCPCVDSWTSNYNP